jgi:hypothetical protein
LVPETAHPVILISPDFVDVFPTVQVPTNQQIPLPVFKNPSLSEPTGSPKDQKEEVVIEILGQSKETEDFGATVNMSAEDLLASQKNGGWDVLEISVPNTVGISDEIRRSKSNFHVNKTKDRFYQSDKNRRDFKSSRLGRVSGCYSDSQELPIILKFPHSTSVRFARRARLSTNRATASPTVQSTSQRGH